MRWLLRRSYPEVPETSDYVMYWWANAAERVSRGNSRRFGLITTNSIVQDYSRKVIERHLSGKDGVTILFAIPDHPWVESADGANVRVAMTVGAPKKTFSGSIILGQVVDDSNLTIEQRKVATIGPKLSAVRTDAVETLGSNKKICFQGVVPAGDGFKLGREEVEKLGFSVEDLPPVVKRYIIGRDIAQRKKERYIIDFFGLSEEEARDNWTSLYQWIMDRVYPERQLNNRAVYREKWWIFAEPRPAMRRALSGLPRFITTPYTAKFRPFSFVDAETQPDAMAYAIASDDPFILGVLSSRIHRDWSLATGGTLENRPRYNSKATFYPFPFPDPSIATKQYILEKAESE